MRRYVCLIVASVLLAACASSRDAPVAAPPAPAAPVALTAATMKATLYDDGLACPGGCDAHVVFHPSHNGTTNAYSTQSSRAAPRPCVDGAACVICTPIRRAA